MVSHFVHLQSAHPSSKVDIHNPRRFSSIERTFTLRGIRHLDPVVPVRGYGGSLQRSTVKEKSSCIFFFGCYPIWVDTVYQFMILCNSPTHTLHAHYHLIGTRYAEQHHVTQKGGLVEVYINITRYFTTFIYPSFTSHLPSTSTRCFLEIRFQLTRPSSSYSSSSSGRRYTPLIKWDSIDCVYYVHIYRYIYISI